MMGIRITVLFLWLLICTNVFFLMPLFHSSIAQQEDIAAHTCWKHTISNPISPVFMPLLHHFWALFPRQGISPQIKFSVPILFLVITKCAHKPEAALWSVLLWYITRGWNDQDHRTLLFLLYEASATPLKSQSVSINTSKEKYNSLILFLKSFEV